MPAKPTPTEPDPVETDVEQAPAGPQRISLVGFEVGRPAPTDAYQALHTDGGVTGPAYTTHPGGGAVQHCVAGATVTDGVMRALTAADAPQEG
ncbi:hypothetical protein [Kitasatospora sp. NPDC127116]|uniref:hypothetical protein n=1 Tax=Kitasatospora sp. NPDC127116 TaxID=3345367 RepID=UPI00362554F0